MGNPNRILDSQMNAGSYTSRYLPYYGRLDEKRGAKAWCLKTWPKKRADYLQADLGTEHSVCAVATQGSFLYHEWLTELHFAGVKRWSNLGHLQREQCREGEMIVKPWIQYSRNFYDGHLIREKTMWPLRSSKGTKCAHFSFSGTDWNTLRF